MKINVFEGKTYEEVLESALKELGVEENSVMVKKEEKKGGLFKGTKIELSIIKVEDVAEFMKKYLNTLITDMGIEVTFESKIREGQVTIKMYSNNNPILIGKNGQTLTALQNIVRQVVYKEIGLYPYIVLDVENYKDKQEKNIERLAKNIAREVEKTKVPAKLEKMNAYERRIVHNALTNFKNVYTESEGEEPNRYIVVYPKKG